MSPGLLTASRAAWVRNHCDAVAEILEPRVSVNERGGTYSSYRRKTYLGRSQWQARVNTPDKTDTALAERPDVVLDATISLEWDALPALGKGCLIRIVGGNDYEVTSSETDRGQALRLVLECRRIEGITILD